MKIFAIFILILITIYSGVYSRTSNPELNKSLVAAARTGNLSRVKQLVNDGADINAVTEGFLPLVEAINNKHTQTAEYIITKGVLVNLQDKDGDTALIVAALRGNMEILPLLKKQGADFNIRNKQGKTALMYGVYGKHSEIVCYLLENGANPILRDKNKLDALSHSIYAKKREIIESLLEYGASITMEHLKLAHKLYCTIDESQPFKPDRNNFPDASKPLENFYTIKKDVDYKPVYNLINTILSNDKMRKAEVYDNGVIKIFDAKSGNFMKAFGNIQFIKKVYYPIAEKIILEKFNNFNITHIKVYLTYNAGVWQMPGHNIYGINQAEIKLLNIENGNYKMLSGGSIYSNSNIFISNTGKYFCTISQFLARFSSLILNNIQTDKTIFIFHIPELNNYFGDNLRINFNPGPIIGFSFNDKYLMMKFYSYENYQQDESKIIAMVLNIATKKYILQKKFYTNINKVNFASNENALLVDYGNGNVTRIPLP